MMKIRCEDGYGAWSSTRNDDETFTFVQIKKEKIKEVYEIFEVDDENNISIEDLKNIRDWVVGLLSDIVRDNAYKKEILTQEEFNKRFVKDE